MKPTDEENYQDYLEWSKSHTSDSHPAPTGAWMVLFTLGLIVVIILCGVFGSILA